MRRTVLALVAATLVASSLAEAHRAPPPVVAPVVVGGIKLVARHTLRSTSCVGLVDAVPADAPTPPADTVDDPASYRPLWRAVVFRVRVRPRLEEDVQWVFIRAMTVDRGVLHVESERGARFTVDLATHAVRRAP